MAENTFDRFSVFFTKDTVFLDGAAFPLGQLTTDVLNLDGEILTEIDRRIDDFMSAVWTLLQEKTDSAARSMQERINAVWDLIFDLPVYRNLRLDLEHNCGRGVPESLQPFEGEKAEGENQQRRVEHFCISDTGSVRHGRGVRIVRSRNAEAVLYVLAR